ncbi:hypothetical protein C3K47_16020 [Solitalea longa]|uniref:DUF4369 domain-containing protein n=1 Tax=Solitalea longa TaxID=2079460 RepID=A0A2S4ZZ15_9SPHI|nr:hypothetical protein [Solitalea longa]POY35289.1 hypothetical protein C3K47_16020 [Solitalea longa]
MRRTVFLVFLLVFSFKAFGQQNVVISGKFENIKPGAFLILNRVGYLGLEGIVDSICIHDDGSFLDTVRNVKEGRMTLLSISNETGWQNNQIKGFLFPYYSLYMTGDVQKGLVNTLKYYDCGSIVNNFIIDRERKFPFDDKDFTIIKPLENRQRDYASLNKNINKYSQNFTQAILLFEAEYTDTVTAYFERKRKFAQDTFRGGLDLDGDFSVRYFEALDAVNNQYLEALSLLKYPSQNVLITHQLGLPWSDVNVHFYRQFEPISSNQFDVYLIVDNYRRFFREYVNLLAGDFDEILNTNPQLSSYTKLFGIAQKQYNRVLRDHVLATIIVEKIDDYLKTGENPAELDDLMVKFKELNPNNRILTQVEAYYQTTKEKKVSAINK